MNYRWVIDKKLIEMKDGISCGACLVQEPFISMTRYLVYPALSLCSVEIKTKINIEYPLRWRFELQSGLVQFQL